MTASGMQDTTELGLGLHVGRLKSGQVNLVYYVIELWGAALSQQQCDYKAIETQVPSCRIDSFTFPG